MHEFRSLIEIGNGHVYEFIFSQVHIEEEKCLVLVFGKNNEFYLFYMKLVGREWKFIERSKIPDFMFALEEKLSLIIIKHRNVT